MEDLIEVSLKISNYKCFGEDENGYDRILPINLIIGRNNSGKSSLIDLMDYVTQPKDISHLGHEGRLPKILISAKLEEKKLREYFPQSGHDDNGRNLWSTGEQCLGRRLIWEQVGKAANFVSLEPPLSWDLPKDNQSRLMRAKKEPFSHYSFKRLAADRDITPEPSNSDFLTDSAKLVKSNGQGATNAIRSFLTKSSLKPELVEKTLLDDLNLVFEPDTHFRRIEVKQLEDERWEVYLEENDKGRIQLSQSGSGLKTVLLVLVYLHLVPAIENKELSAYLFGFEELENNLHPALQRRLLSYLRKTATKKGCRFFLTTHSSVAIDLFANDDQAQILHVTHNGKCASVRAVKTYIENCGIIDDLDIRASDLLQANGIVWLEGPSDRLYFNHWMEVWTNGELKEGTHYQCVFYGGSLLAHLSADEPEEISDNAIKILRVNRNAILLADSDKKSETDQANKTKQRLLSEIQRVKGLGWITFGREVENYIPKAALDKHLPDGEKKQFEQFDDIADYLSKFQKNKGNWFERNKVLFAMQVIPFITKENIMASYDLASRLDEVCRVIRNWNRLPENISHESSAT